MENFGETIEMIREGVINMAIAENIIFEMIKTPTISARKVRLFGINLISSIMISNNNSSQFVEENNQTVIRDPEELRKLCKFCIEKYDKVTKKARRGKEGEFEKLVKAVLKESDRRADVALTKPILQELLKSN